MTMQKIKADKHGLYVSCNASIHRPVPAIRRYVGVNSTTKNPFDYVATTDGPHVIRGTQYHSWVTGTSRYAEGDEVNVKNINYTPYSNVGGELWTTHGEKLILDRATNKMRKVPTELCFWNGQTYESGVAVPPLTDEELKALHDVAVQPPENDVLLEEGAQRMREALKSNPVAMAVLADDAKTFLRMLFPEATESQLKAVAETVASSYTLDPVQGLTRRQRIEVLTQQITEAMRNAENPSALEGEGIMKVNDIEDIDFAKQDGSVEAGCWEIIDQGILKKLKGEELDDDEETSVYFAVTTMAAKGLMERGVDIDTIDAMLARDYSITLKYSQKEGESGRYEFSLVFDDGKEVSVTKVEGE